MQTVSPVLQPSEIILVHHSVPTPQKGDPAVAVHFVPDEGVTEVCQMKSDLVGTSRPRDRLEPGVATAATTPVPITKVVKNTELGLGRLPVLSDRHLDSDRSVLVGANRRVDLHRSVSEISTDKGQIRLVQRPGLKRRLHPPIWLDRPRHNQDA